MYVPTFAICSRGRYRWSFVATAAKPKAKYDDADLFNQIDKVLLGTEDRICQDMGFVKVAINTKMKTNQVTIPNTSFKRFVTAHQKEVIEQLSEAFNMDIDARLKTEQKENMKLATKIKPIVDKYSQSV